MYNMEMEFDILDRLDRNHNARLYSASQRQMRRDEKVKLIRFSLALTVIYAVIFVAVMIYAM